MSKLYPSVSGLSILMALALAVEEWYFFFTEEPGKGTESAPFAARRSASGRINPDEM